MAGLNKLPLLRQLPEDVLKYGILKKPYATVYAVSLPVIELGLAVLLFSGFLPQLAAAFSIGLLATFMIAVGSAMIRRLSLDCTCFGLLYREKVGWHTQIRDLIMILLAAYALLFGDTTYSLSSMLSDPDGSAPALTAIVLTFAASSWISALSLRLHLRTTRS